MISLNSLVLLAASYAWLAAAQQGDTVWGAVTVSTFGDRVPLLSPSYSVITSLGAQQMYTAGQMVRERYITQSNATGNYSIVGISQNQIDNLQTLAYSLYEIFIDQSTQAFMAGLYPPLDTSFDISIDNQEGQALVDNTTVNWPVNGLQYPFVSSISGNDFMDIYLEGMNNCPALQESINDYKGSWDFEPTVSATNGFYQSLAPKFVASLPQNNTQFAWNLSYNNAYEIWDYLSYQYIHDASSGITPSIVDQARHLADAYTGSIYGNTTATIQTMGGQTLIGYILSLLQQNMRTFGQEQKLSNIFTSYEPLVSLFSLLGLDRLSDNFLGMPNLASTVSFELYTNSTVAIPNPLPSDWYPSMNDLNIRFLFRNGTTASTNLSANGLDVYPIFGNGPGQPSMPYSQFFAAVENVMMLDVGNWCETCQSNSVFCAAATNGTVGFPSNSGSSSSHQVSPVIAGVIGALVALVVAGIFFLLAMLLFGIRFRKVKGKRRSELGGFKGSEKLASDPDLPSQKQAATAKNGAVIGASVVPETMGHRRVESWELKEGRGGDGRVVDDRGRPSFENDDEGRIKAAEAVERV